MRYAGGLVTGAIVAAHGDNDVMIVNDSTRHNHACNLQCHREYSDNAHLDHVTRSMYNVRRTEQRKVVLEHRHCRSIRRHEDGSTECGGSPTLNRVTYPCIASAVTPSSWKTSSSNKN
jgi:hypothetical protein